MTPLKVVRIHTATILSLVLLCTSPIAAAGIGDFLKEMRDHVKETLGENSDSGEKTEETRQEAGEKSRGDDQGASPEPADESVAYAQRALTELGYDTRGADGLYGAATRGAVKAFQTDQGMEPSGELDKETLDAIEAAASRAGIVVDRPGTESGPVGENSRVDQLDSDLRKLKSLRDEGILTDEEFNEQKRALLGTVVVGQDGQEAAAGPGDSAGGPQPAVAAATPSASQATGPAAGASLESLDGGDELSEDDVIQLDKASYTTGDPIGVTTDCAQYGPHDWVSVVAPDAGIKEYGTYKSDWLYFRDRPDCDFEFAARGFPGQYEVRIIPANGDFIAARKAFAVTKGEGPASGGLRLGGDAYATNQEIEAIMPCPPEDAIKSDWIGLFEASKSSYSYGVEGRDWYSFSKAERSGDDCVFKFPGREKKGRYELRAFHGSNYQAYARLGFEIAKTGVRAAPPEQTTAPQEQKEYWLGLFKQNFAVGEAIKVAINCHQKQYLSSNPWIGLRLASEAVHSHPQRGNGVKFRQDWFYLKNYTQPGKHCIYEFGGRQRPGDYEVRVFLTNEDCACEDNLAVRLPFTVVEGNVSEQAKSVKKPFVMTAAPSRHKQYDYVKVDSKDCISLAADHTSFENVCDFPVSAYFTRKVGYVDQPVQHVPSLAPGQAGQVKFDYKGTVDWLACHESQKLCMRALRCIQDVHDTGQEISGYVTAHCRAFEKGSG